MATLNDLAVSVIKFGETLERVKREIEAMNDKQPKVWLTVEEAKTLIDFFVTMKPEMPNGGCMEYCDLWRDFLQKRIEQAEKKK